MDKDALHMYIRACMLSCAWSHGLQHSRLLCSWDFSGRNTGVGCYFLLQRSNPHFLHWQAPANAGNVGNVGLTPGSGRSLEKEVTTHFSILAWTEEPGRLQPMGSQKSWIWLGDEATIMCVCVCVCVFKILKDDALKVLHSICQQIWKTQQLSKDWKKSVFIPIPKNVQTPTQLCSFHIPAR